MTELPAPPPPIEERQKLRIPQYGFVTLVVQGTALCTADDPSVVGVYGTRDALAIVGRKPGKTSLRVERPGKPGEMVDVEVGDPVPNAYALGVGEELTVFSGGVRMSDAEKTAGSIATVSAKDEMTMTIHGHRSGTAKLLVVRLDGSQVVLEVTVLEGDRQL